MSYAPFCKTPKMIENRRKSESGGTFSPVYSDQSKSSEWHLNGSGPTALNKNRIPAILPALFTISLSL